MDELHELDELNPIQPTELVAATAIDPETLLELFTSDSRSKEGFNNRFEHPVEIGEEHELGEGAGRVLMMPATPSHRRLGYLGAGLVAAALVAVALVGTRDRGGDLAVVAPAIETVPDVEAEEPPATSVPTDGTDRTDGDGDGAVDGNGGFDGGDETDNNDEVVDGAGETVDDVEVEPPPVTVETPRASGTNSETTAEPSAPADPDDGSSVADEVIREGDALPPTASLGAAAANRATLEGPFNPVDDLVSLHVEHAPSRDDGLAAVAALEIATWLAIEPHVVNGTYGTNARRFDPESATVMNATWGDRWLDAHADRPSAVQQTADRWQRTLEDGGDVWVAEGGQSDFTADVVREIQARMPDLATGERIHVVQHATANEKATTPGDLAMVKADTDYRRIEDGNRANTTADLEQESAEFEAATRNSPHATAWQVAFDRMEPDAGLDFSDTVALLHILGISIDQVSDPTTFARYFMAST